MLKTKLPRAPAKVSSVDIKSPTTSFSFDAASTSSPLPFTKSGNFSFALSMNPLKSSINDSVSRRWEKSPA